MKEVPRREALLCAAGFLTGCSGVSGTTETTSTDSSTPTATTTSTPTAIDGPSPSTHSSTNTSTKCKKDDDNRSSANTFRTYSAEGKKDIGGTTLSTDLEVVRQPNSNHPAALQATLRNTGSKRVDVQFGADLPITPMFLESSDSDGAVIPLPADHRNVEMKNGKSDPLYLSEPVNRCWQLPENTVIVEAMGQSGLDAGEAVRREYVLLANTKGNECLSPGKYQAEQTYIIESQKVGFKCNITVVEP